MSDVSRVCPQCGGKVAIDSRFCGGCGYDTSAGLPVARSNVPAQIAAVALPVAASLAGWAVRAGWQLLRTRLEEMAKNPPITQQPAPVSHPTPPTQENGGRTRRTIHIRSTWAVGDGRGVWRQGAEEHHIDIEE